MTLILSVVILVTASVGTLLLGSGLYGALTLVGVSVGLADGIAYALMGILAVFGLLPLVAGCYRLACLEARRACLEARRSCFAARQGCPSAGETPTLPAVDESPELWGLFQPFTSLRAYGRALAVGLEWLGWGLAVFGIPALCFRISSLLRSVSDAVSDAAGGTVSEAVLPFLEGLDLIDALFLSLVGGLGFAVPVPGGIGAFHFIISLALSAVYGIPMEMGIIYATLSHTSQAITQILFGLGSYASESLRK
jgi:hypothetical protein